MSVTTNDESTLLECAYLVVGAGTAGMSFIDTLLTESTKPTTTVILVDRNSKAGGHWTTAYPHVRLHQPSCFYGVNSLQLGTTLSRRKNELYDLDDRATGKEVVEYYEKVIQKFHDSGRFQVYFNSEYLKDEETGHHIITSSSTNTKYRVKCQKLVMINSKVHVPSMRKGKLPFPTHPESPQIIPVNDLSQQIQTKESSSPTRSLQQKKYIVIGAGKTGVDSIEYLLRNNIDQSNITWIVSRDAWFFTLDGYVKPDRTYYQSVQIVVKALSEQSAVKDAFLFFEKNGIIARLDPNGPFPEVFKGSIVYLNTLELIRTVTDVVRMGKVTSIGEDSIVLEEGTLSLSSPNDTVIVDCMANTDTSTEFYGYDYPENFSIYQENQINLGPLPIVFNPSLTSALTAFLEVHLGDNKVKNDMLIYVKGDDFKYNHIGFISMLYGQFRTINALENYLPATMFYIKSRTNSDSPRHHKGGMLRLLWSAVGPLGLKRLGDKFVKKYANGGYSDSEMFGCDSEIPNKKTIKRALRRKREKI